MAAVGAGVEQALDAGSVRQRRTVLLAQGLRCGGSARAGRVRGGCCCLCRDNRAGRELVSRAGAGELGAVEGLESGGLSVPPGVAGTMFQGLYHGVSAMALKGLTDMGDNFSAKGNEHFSQLPTQQY